MAKLIQNQPDETLKPIYENYIKDSQEIFSTWSNRKQ